jgi:phosphoglycolate phosphatase
VNSAPLGRPSAGPTELLAHASCLLLDFDGPLCRLFAHSSPVRIARAMRGLLAAGGAPLTDPEFAATDDPHRIVQAPVTRELAVALELLLAAEEELAARSATPTPDAEEFVRLMAERGLLLAITTNNAPRAVETYLKDQALDGWFEGRIFGRSTEDPRRMKPHPDCLLRALETLEVAPRDCLMIGDSPADAAAAAAAGTPFLGYARSADRVARLQRGHPYPVVVGMRALIGAAGAGAPPNG